jgi:hypothetical protein
MEYFRGSYNRAKLYSYYNDEKAIGFIGNRSLDGYVVL